MRRFIIVVLPEPLFPTIASISSGFAVKLISVITGTILSYEKDTLSYKAFNFLINNLNRSKLHDKLSVYHDGVCSKCHRKLTTPESLKKGMGPICSPKKKKNIKELRLMKLEKLT